MISRRQNITKIFLLSLLVGGAVILAAPVFAQAKDPCFDLADRIRIKVNGTEFSIPAMYAPSLETVDKNLIPKTSCRKNGSLVYGIRQEPADNAFEVKQFFIDKLISRTPAQTSKPDAPYPLFAFMDISIGGALIGGAEGFYCGRQSEIEKKIKGWKPSVNNKKFAEADDLAGLGKVNGKTYYLSKKITFSEFPVLIECSRQEASIPAGAGENGYAGSRSIGRFCTFKGPLGGANSVSLRFHDKELPPEKWEEALKNVESFIQKIAVTSVSPIEFVSCDKPPIKGE